MQRRKLGQSPKLIEHRLIDHDSLTPRPAMHEAMPNHTGLPQRSQRRPQLIQIHRPVRGVQLRATKHAIIGIDHSQLHRARPGVDYKHVRRAGRHHAQDDGAAAEPPLHLHSRISGESSPTSRV